MKPAFPSSKHTRLAGLDLLHKYQILEYHDALNNQSISRIDLALSLKTTNSYLTLHKSLKVKLVPSPRYPEPLTTIKSITPMPPLMCPATVDQKDNCGLRLIDGSFERRA